MVGFGFRVGVWEEGWGGEGKGRGGEGEGRGGKRGPEPQGLVKRSLAAQVFWISIPVIWVKVGPRPT